MASDIKQRWIDRLEHVANSLERKWGCGRLQVLVEPELADRFRVQRELVNKAIWDEKDIAGAGITAAGPAMERAWLHLDQVATTMGCLPLSPDVWEHRLADGTVMVITRSVFEANAIVLDGRKAVIFTLAEVCELMKTKDLLTVLAAKEIFPGATVRDVHPIQKDDPLDDEIPF